MDLRIERLLSRLEDFPFPEPLDPRHAFHYASLLGEVLMIKNTLTNCDRQVVDEQIGEYLDQGEKRFQEVAFIRDLEKGIQELVDAHRNEWVDIDFFVEADAFYELDMLLSGRDRLEYVSEAVKYYGDNKKLRKAIEGYAELDEILRSRIQAMLTAFEDDFRAQPPTRWYPASFWWRPLWACVSQS
jgi:hypothetical protein